MAGQQGSSFGSKQSQSATICHANKIIAMICGVAQAQSFLCEISIAGPASIVVQQVIRDAWESEDPEPGIRVDPRVHISQRNSKHFLQAIRRLFKGLWWPCEPFFKGL